MKKIIEAQVVEFTTSKKGTNVTCHLPEDVIWQMSFPFEVTKKIELFSALTSYFKSDRIGFSAEENLLKDWNLQ